MLHTRCICLYTILPYCNVIHILVAGHEQAASCTRGWLHRVGPRAQSGAKARSRGRHRLGPQHIVGSRHRVGPRYKVRPQHRVVSNYIMVSRHRVGSRQPSRARAHLAQPLCWVTGFHSSVPCIRPDQSLSMMSWLETQANSRGERRFRMPQGLTSVSRSSISSMSCPSRWSACLTALQVCHLSSSQLQAGNYSF